MVRPYCTRPVAHVRTAGVWRNRRRDGTVIDVDVVSAQLTFNGRPARLILAEDVTERRRLDEALRESEERFRNLFSHAPVAQATFSLDGHFLQVNSAMCGMTGYGGRDITDAKAAQDRLAHQALHDDLTDLPNRALFLDRLSQSLRRLDRREGMVAVLFLDLDRFKSINDVYGHFAGDQVLVEVAGRLMRERSASTRDRPVTHSPAQRAFSDRHDVLQRRMIDAPCQLPVPQRLRHTSMPQNRQTPPCRRGICKARRANPP